MVFALEGSSDLTRVTYQRINGEAEFCFVALSLMWIGVELSEYPNTHIIHTKYQYAYVTHNHERISTMHYPDNENQGDLQLNAPYNIPNSMGNTTT